MDVAFLKARIDAVKLLIVQIEAAIDFVIANPTAEYRLDTGQTSQRVKRHDLNMLEDMLNGAMNRLATLEARLYGSGSHTGGLAW